MLTLHDPLGVTDVFRTQLLTTAEIVETAITCFAVLACLEFFVTAIHLAILSHRHGTEFGRVNGYCSLDFLEHVVYLVLFVLFIHNLLIVALFWVI